MKDAYHGWLISDHSWHSRMQNKNVPLFYGSPPPLPYSNKRRVDQRCLILGKSRAEVKRKIRSHRARWGW